jgi:hypothetical protein
MTWLQNFGAGDLEKNRFIIASICLSSKPAIIIVRSLSIALAIFEILANNIHIKFMLRKQQDHATYLVGE